MEMDQQAGIQFPRDLVEWAGHHSGGVKRLFDSSSGRPVATLLRTNLICKLESWTQAVASGTEGTPRILLLVGGPGNGKTEAIEHTIKCLDHGLAANGRLIQTLSREFHPLSGVVPRLVQANAGVLAFPPRQLELDVVQDASVKAAGENASVLLVEELSSLLAAPESKVYLCCVNRGVLDEALIHALDNNLAGPAALLETITRAVGLSCNAPSCWPLEGFPNIAVWPMDAESLLTSPGDGSPPPADSLLEYATNPSYWLPTGECAAGDKCPFCNSQALLSREGHRVSLLRILRWYELASGKRWSFRDLFSMVSYLLAGNHQAEHGQQADPCKWAAHLLKLDQSTWTGSRSGRNKLTAIFHLATSGYQHALFHKWDRGAAVSLRQDIKDLGLSKDDEDVQVILGLLAFLEERKVAYLPSTISSLLENIADLLDPALASPDTEVPVSGRSTVMLGDIDGRFSRSLSSGIEFIRKYQALSNNELELLKRLAKADSMLSLPSVRRKKPAAASRIQRVVRDFACRLVRRSICTRSAVVADAANLEEFQKILDNGHSQHIHEVSQQIKDLLNSRQGFEVSLTTTFGQPLPPAQRQSTLVVQSQSVKPLPLAMTGRPRSPICFLQVGHGRSSQPIALTYDLFKTVKELERGLSPASLPRTVVALMDATKARLSGHIVRDEEVLDDARIRIGSDGVQITKAWDGFVAIKVD